MQARGWIRNNGPDGVDADFHYDFLCRGRRLQAVESNFIGEHNFFQQIVYASTVSTSATPRSCPIPPQVAINPTTNLIAEIVADRINAAGR